MSLKSVTTKLQCRLFSTTKNLKAPVIPLTNFPTPEYKGPSYEKITSIRKKNITPCIHSHFKKPLLIHSGKMQWLFDHTGKRYLDMFGGIVTVSVGHCHDKVNAALEKQLNTLWHTTNIYMHPKIHEYAEKLTSKLPKDLNVVYFVNSGSEANDLAMLMARLHTGNYDIIGLQNGYHGDSPYLMGLAAHSTWRYPVPGTFDSLHHAMLPDPYNGIWGGKKCRDSISQTSRNCDCVGDHCAAGDRYFEQLETLFKYSVPHGKVAGMFAESIQGVGGTVQYTKGYIKRAAELIRSNGGVFISDEVQTGFGRTGENFWAFESHGIVPDIVTMAKGIGNGFPLAACITTKEIAKCMNTALHFNTFGGNPLASSVGLAVLEVIEEEKLQQNSLVVGNYLISGLMKLRDKHEIVGDVRGKGLMIGVEMVTDKKTKQFISSSHLGDIWEHCKDLGVLFGRGGIHGNILRIKPPMCINKDDVDFALEVLDEGIRKFT